MIAATRREGGEMEWQPIESAPKDGTWIFGYWPSMSITDYPAVIFADDHSNHDIWYMPSNFEFGCVYPTHWMPLPAPPARGEQ